MEEEGCEVTCINEATVLQVKKRIDGVDLCETSALFKLFADENRLKIVYALMEEQELCVCELAAIIEATTAATSHHLQALKRAAIVNRRKEGKLVYYFIVNKQMTQLLRAGVALQQEVLV